MKKCANDTIQVWYADNASAGGNCFHDGPQFGYCPKASKSSVVVKQGFKGKALEVFEGTGLRVTHEGSMHLGIPLGSTDFQNRCIDEKVQEWCAQVKCVAMFAGSQSCATYSLIYIEVLKHGGSKEFHCSQSNWVYLSINQPF